MSKNWKKFIFPCSNVTILTVLVMSHDFLIPYSKLFLILKKSTVSNKLTVCFEGTINMLLKHHVEVPDDVPET